MSSQEILYQLVKNAHSSAQDFAFCPTNRKNEALDALTKALIKRKGAIEKANALDLEAAASNGLSQALLDRLSLKGRIPEIAEGVSAVRALPDPIGEILEEKILANGLHLKKIRVPLGLLGVIYEARPNVTVEIASLCLKTGNGAVLRGGKETIRTNKALTTAIHEGLQEAHLSPNIIQFIDNPDRDLVRQLIKMDSLIDMIIPRGGEQLHRFCKEEGTIPVITGGIGICHLFIDASADLEKSLDVIINAKTQRPTVCNALDTLLVHQDIAEQFLPQLINSLKERGVSMRLDSKAHAFLGDLPSCQQAMEDEWSREWLSLVLGIKVVDSVEEAIAHIRKYSSKHSDGILTETPENADIFAQKVDSAVVYVNASTRFTDGYQFGLGAEVAVSTQKLHARGPMGLEALTTYKWVVEGDYHVRES